MQKRTALSASCLLGAILWLTSSVSLGSTSLNHDIALWRMPFTDRVVQVPLWVWSVAVYVWLASPVTVAVLWICVAVRSWKLRTTARG